MHRILIADDHAIVRQGFARIIELEEDLEVTGEAATGAEVLDKAQAGSFDAIVLDLNLPDMSGLDVLKELRSRELKAPVLMLSMYGENEFGLRVMQAGASGYLSKESAPDQLVMAIQRILGGGQFVSEALEAKLKSLHEDGEGAPHEQLSDREFEVMRLLAQGKSVTEIAQSLVVSVKTVSTFRTRLLQKLDLGSNAEIAQYAIRNNLIH